ncbi:MAG: FapA family protein [Lachnospiraceae bacterium]|nr:FapA family protein [Lachnospiraceae bacterium]
MGEIEFSREQMNKLKGAMVWGDEGEEVSAEVKKKDFGWDSCGTNLARGTRLRVEKDGMAAWLYLAPPDNGQVYRKDELITYLERNGVVKGYHNSNLSAMIKKKVYEREILVAKGQEVQKGEDGWYEYLFTPEEYGVPKIREDGTVDYTSMSALHNVHSGEKVAVYHHAKPGANGYTVRGVEVTAKPPKELQPLRGKGVERIGDEYFAQTDGKIEAKNGKIDIQKVHEVAGDVTLIVGRVEFFGDVIINGNVENGVVIRAGRNIEIHGTSGSATLIAGGDVIISRGIQGGGRIVAKGSVFADFIENTTVQAGGTVLSNTILNANVSAEDKVITTGKKGAVIGGYVHGFKGIEAMTAGSDAEVKTILHSGYEMKSYERLLEIRRRESEIKAKLSELVDNMTDAMRETRMGSTSLSLAAEIKMAERDRMKDQYFEELDKISREKETLEELMEASQGAYIKVDGTMYRNLVICINVEQLTLNRNSGYMKYTADNGVLEGNVIIH